jgi:peptidoglycan/LPS O-acetylase OafA/YrhL
VDALRGLAALAVCWFHITITSAILNDGIFRSTGKYGWLGVEVFFVISGFIIPYALQRSGYKLKNYPIFLVKRITRLDPPYIASIVLVIAVTFFFTFSPHYSGGKFAIDPVGLLLHLGYLNVIFHYPWLNPVYWTLAIEFQYYLLVGLIFSLISNKHRVVRLLTFGLLGLTAVLIREGRVHLPLHVLIPDGYECLSIPSEDCGTVGVCHINFRRGDRLLFDARDVLHARWVDRRIWHTVS